MKNFYEIDMHDFAKNEPTPKVVSPKYNVFVFFYALKSSVLLKILRRKKPPYLGENHEFF